MTDTDRAEPPSYTGRDAPVVVAVLAAGAGTRMRSAMPKPLHPVAGRPMIAHVLDAAAGAQPSNIILVVGPDADALIEALNGWTLEAIVQDAPRGTGDAARLALAAAGNARWLVVLFADHPLLTPHIVERLVDGARAHQSLVTVLSTVVEDAGSYGRIERDGDGRPSKIVERKDDHPDHRIGPTEINSGMMVLDVAWARTAATQLEPNPVTGEFYLTDLVELAVTGAADAMPAWPVAIVQEEPDVAVGVNDRVQLAAADGIARRRIRERLMLSGVSIVAPETVMIDAGVTIGPDTTILPFSVIQTGTAIGSGCLIGPHAVLAQARIGDGVTIRSSTITQSAVLDGSDVGPYSHVRGGTEIGPRAHIGNFAELKQTRVEEGTKIGHVSYLGDATVGAGTNIGAGTITCNFDGVSKHRTEIGPGAFIGSDSMLVAPLIVGAGARTGAGSVVTKDVEPGATVVGVPARQITRVNPLGSAGPEQPPEGKERRR